MTLSHVHSAVVVDASATVEMLVGDATWVDRFRGWRQAGALLLAPAHFRAEVANALLLSVGLEPEVIVSRLRLLFSAGVEIADRGLLGTIDALDLASRHHLTVYDAIYLSLALDIDGELATQDKALIKAARAEGVTVIE